MSHLVKCHCYCYCYPFCCILSTIINTSHLVKMQRHHRSKHFYTHPELLFIYKSTFIIRVFKPPLFGLVGMAFLFTFLDDVVWYAAVYIYVINFIFHFSLKSGIMQILNAIFYGYEMCRLGLYI